MSSKRGPGRGSKAQASRRQPGASAAAIKLLDDAPPDSIADILAVTRRYLDMDVAFVTEFDGDRRWFRHVDPLDGPLQVGSWVPLDEGYCKRIVEGELPELMPDTGAHALAREQDATWALGIGAHVGVPIRLRDQRLYGTFCCFSGQPDMTLNRRDLGVMHAFADLVATQIDRALDIERSRTDLRRRIEAAIAGEHRQVVFQPIVNLVDGRIIGLESLSRFSVQEHRPETWFADAASLGLQPALECAAIHSALAALPHLPGSVYLAVNVSPSTILHESFDAVLADAPVDRLVLELTEHVDVLDYAVLAAKLAPFRQRRLRLAVDDAGAGYASFQHILNLRPDIIKLDMTLTRNIDADAARRAFASALVSFAAEIGCQLVAEGIETAAELATLRAFGVTLAQGYRLGRPAPLAEILRRLAEG